MAERICECCGAQLEKEVTEEPDERDKQDGVLGLESYVCYTQDCELKGRLQPEQDGASAVAWNRDGNAQVFQRGATSQNEGNLPTTIARLSEHLPERFQVTELTGGGNVEAGVDLVVACGVCSAQTEAQVVRSVSPKLAKAARGNAAAWTSETPEKTISRLAETIRKKTLRYAAHDIATRLLVIDATVDTFWTAAVNKALVRTLVEQTPWLGIVLTGPSTLIWAKGTGPRCTCPPENPP